MQGIKPQYRKTIYVSRETVMENQETFIEKVMENILQSLWELLVPWPVLNRSAINTDKSGIFFVIKSACGNPF